MTRAEKIRRRLRAQFEFLLESSTDDQVVALYESLAQWGAVSPVEDDAVSERISALIAHTEAR